MKKAAEANILLGIDPGLANTGWGVIQKCGSKLECVAYGCITTPAGMSTHERLKVIRDDVSEIIAFYHPQAMGIEAVFFGANAKTEVVTAEARGAALIAAADAGLDVGEYSPPQIKAAVVGNGSATKEQVQFMVKSLLHLQVIPKPDHAADALAAAVCYSRVARFAKIEACAPITAQKDRSTT